MSVMCCEGDLEVLLYTPSLCLGVPPPLFLESLPSESRPRRESCASRGGRASRCGLSRDLERSRLLSLPGLPPSLPLSHSLSLSLDLDR